MIVEVDLRGLVPPGLFEALSEAALQSVVLDIAEAARDKWMQLAGEELFTSRRDYIAGIQMPSYEEGTAVITLVGTMPNLIENGMAEVDLHDTLLGPNVPLAPVGQRGKHLSIKPSGEMGFYRSIPFRHGTPDSGGAVGAPMGHAYRGILDAAALGKKIYSAAKKLAPTTSSPYGGTTYGGRLPEGLAPKLKSHHAVDIYAGMVKETKTYESATQSQYTTFRTISTGSPGWIRPATQGRHLAAKVGEFISRLAPDALQAYLSGIGE